MWLFFVTDVFNGQKMFQKVCNMPTLYLKEKLLRNAAHDVVRFIQKGAIYDTSYSKVTRRKMVLDMKYLLMYTTLIPKAVDNLEHQSTSTILTYLYITFLNHA